MDKEALNKQPLRLRPSIKQVQFEFHALVRKQQEKLATEVLKMSPELIQASLDPTSSSSIEADATTVSDAARREKQQDILPLDGWRQKIDKYINSKTITNYAEVVDTLNEVRYYVLGKDVRNKHRQIALGGTVTFQIPMETIVPTIVEFSARFFYATCYITVFVHSAASVSDAQAMPVEENLPVASAVLVVFLMDDMLPISILPPILIADAVANKSRYDAPSYLDSLTHNWWFQIAKSIPNTTPGEHHVKTSLSWALGNLVEATNCVKYGAVKRMCEIVWIQTWAVDTSPESKHTIRAHGVRSMMRLSESAFEVWSACIYWTREEGIIFIQVVLNTS